MNELLRLACNRETGFTSPAFPLVSDFHAKAAGSDLTTLRNLLRLQASDPDWYTVGALSTAHCFPDYLTLVGEQHRTYDLAAYRRAEDLYHGGYLSPSPAGPPRIHRIPVEWPIQFDIELTYHSPTTATLYYAGSSSVVDVRVLDSRLILAWPAATGVSGEVTLDQPWDTTSQFRIIHEPISYPHAKVAELLKSSSAAQAILQRAGLAGAFYAAPLPSEKVAATVVALALAQRAHE